MSQVAVTGAAGPVGRRVVAALAADEAVERIVAIDRESMSGLTKGAGGDRVEAHRVHLKDADLVPLLEGVDVVCHLAGSDPLEGTPVDHDLHTTGRLLEAAAKVGVDQVIVRSSATVYGAWPDNPVPLSETAPIRPNPESAWVRSRADVEHSALSFAADHPGVAVTILRPCITVSPQGPDELGRVLAAARLVTSAEGTQGTQFVHADDVASAVDVVRRAGAEGIFNVAPDGALGPELIRALAGGVPRLPFSASVAHRLTSLGWRYQLSPTPPGFVPFVNHPWVVANDRLRSLGWEPQHTNEEAFVAGHAAAPWATISPQRRQELALGVAAAGVLAGIGGAVTLLRRRLRS